MNRFLWAMTAVLATAVAAMAGDVPEAALDPAIIGGLIDALPVAWKAQIMVWSPVAALVFGILFKVSELLSLIQRIKPNGVVQGIGSILRAVLKYLPKGAALMGVFLLGACTTLNISMNTTAGDDNKPAVKTDAEANQTISPNTSATIPLR